jgi:hypothetical protein
MFSQGSGEAFTKAFEALDKQMIMAILVTARAIVEAQKSSKADSESSLDIFDVLVNFIRGMLELTLYEQVLCRWYRYNIGDDVENCPRVSLTDDTGRNFATAGPVVSQLWAGGFLHDSQVEGLDQKLGLPPRDYKAWQEERDAKAEADAQAAAESAKLMNPAASSGGD